MQDLSRRNPDPDLSKKLRHINSKHLLGLYQMKASVENEKQILKKRSKVVRKQKLGQLKIIQTKNMD